MKKLKLVLVVLVTVFISCSSLHKRYATDKLKSFMAGTYIRAFSGDYSYGKDTLIIEKPDMGNNYFIIQHKISYQQIKNRQPLPVEYKTENWTALFNEQTNVLEEQTKGKRLSFLPGEKALLLGGSKFKKIE